MPVPLGATGVLEGVARRDPQLLVDENRCRHELADQVLDLQAGVQLDEVERAVGPEEELEGAGVRVADRSNRTFDSRLHLLAKLGRHCRRRRLFDQFLMAALDRALALAEGENAAVRVSQHLDLDVARGTIAFSR